MHNLAVPNDRVSRIDFARMVEETGFVVVPRCLDEEMVQRLCACLSATTYATRNLLTVPIVRELATSPSVRALAETVLGKNCFAVKATFFNKTQEANWKVVWHQDLTIAVRERVDVHGFGPWTTKAGVSHVQPSVEVMSRILAIRLHLDESGLDNGPLRVIPGSHRHGRLSAEQIQTWNKEKAVTCAVPKGGALLMRPLLLHASSECAVAKCRRVIHLEFAAAELPLGLHWHEKV